MNAVLKFFTSLRLTVWLLGISVLLIYMGSWAEVEEGLWRGQVRWFQNWWVIRQPGDAFWVPPVFPAGHTIGLLLVINLVAAHIKRFTWNFQKFGIQLTHFGVIVMLIGQLITDERKVESYMNFSEGESRNYTENHRDAELVFLHEADAQHDEAVSFPQGTVFEKGTLTHSSLPFTVRVLDAGKNGDVIGLEDISTAAAQLQRAVSTVEARFSSAEGLVDLAKADMAQPVRLVVWRKALADLGELESDISVGAANVAKDPKRAPKLLAALKEAFRGQMVEAWNRAGGERAYAVKLLQEGKLAEAAQTKPSATKGYGTTNFIVPLEEITDDEKGRNLPWAIVEITANGGKEPLGRWLISAMSSTEQSFDLGGKKWRMALRFERYYLPFSITLVRARQDTYLGTQQAKEYASEVRVKNPATGEDRPVNISMNYPLRYGGLTFYQSTMGQGRQGLGIAAFLEAYTGRPRADFIERENAAADRSSGLQVVENPSMLAPYSGCILVGFGMLWQFLLHLTGFLAKRVGLPSPSYGVQHPLLPVCALLIVIPDIFLGVVAFREHTLFILAVLAVTPLIRSVIAWQVWKGRYHVFSMVFLLVATLLMLVFAIKYHQEYGRLLWPIVSCQLAAFIGLAYIVFGHLPQEKAASQPA
jgi:hypothetical protein